jgi:hypothetical protein
VTKLALEDISDLRAYEREREQFRADVIALKKRRRVPVGPLLTFVFENRDTIRFQIQEMARVERMATDAAIRTELETYNPLIPEAGELSATLFIELTSEPQLRHWLPALVGIERAVELVIGDGGGGRGPLVVPAQPEAAHATQLTRDQITASVHYLHWTLTTDEVEAFALGPVVLAVNHPAYVHGATLNAGTRQELLADLRG